MVVNYLHISLTCFACKYIDKFITEELKQFSLKIALLEAILIGQDSLICFSSQSGGHMKFYRITLDVDVKTY